MKTNPENPKSWSLPDELPPTFALPKEFRESLPDEVQQWLNSVERRIDGMTLRRVKREAGELAGEDSPEAKRLYQLGRRLFYVRMQQIIELVFPDQGVEVGIDLLCGQAVNVLPGFAVTNAIMDDEDLGSISRRQQEEAGVAVGA